ncbi:hypothetical protein WJX74_008784 [Apatococcus lobatus]|uniref:BZIP domain-containing protein n=1 Tax=Apatococcus lobatus TaxID=904363 RepID=A0AAW1SH10_9CHLO
MRSQLLAVESIFTLLERGIRWSKSSLARLQWRAAFPAQVASRQQALPWPALCRLAQGPSRSSWKPRTPGTLDYSAREVVFKVAASFSDSASLSLTTSSLETAQPAMHRQDFVLSDTEQLAQHAQQEALLYQSTDAQRRERNRVAQAASRQRKRLKLAADTEALQQSADRIRVLEQQIVALKTGRAMPVAEAQRCLA